MPGNFLDENEAAQYLGIAKKTLSRRRWAGSPPSFHRFGRSVRYAIKDLDEFISNGFVSR